MAEPLKNKFNKKLVENIAFQFNRYFNQFDQQSYICKVIGTDWNELELKARMRRISSVLPDFLPSNYPESLKIVEKVSGKFSGMTHMCFPDYVEQFGLDHFELSMDALARMTKSSSSEFAVRPFIISDSDAAISKLKEWAKSDCEHIRRLASEGCRPRLPWAMALPEFKSAPSPIIEILLTMIDDESLYVRRSVANNLNDISKDNPDSVINIASKYLGRTKNIDWVIKHACRSLLKQGDPKVLPLFGYLPPKNIQISRFKLDDSVTLGENLNFQFEVSAKKGNLNQLRLEFVIDFLKSNGKHSAKVFKISEGNYEVTSREINKYFSFKPITTRKYYPGTHRLGIKVNGEKLTEEEFELIG